MKTIKYSKIFTLTDNTLSTRDTAYKYTNMESIFNNIRVGSDSTSTLYYIKVYSYP